MIFILGASPSLSDFDLSVLEQKTTLAINGVYQALPFAPTYQLWQDKNFYKYHHHQLASINSIKYACDQSIFKTPKFKVLKFFNVSKLKPNWRNTTTYLSGWITSGAKATQLAYALGYTEITLLGVDGKVAENKNEWHGNNPFWGNHTLNKIRKDLEFIRTFPGKLYEPKTQDELKELC